MSVCYECISPIFQRDVHPAMQNMLFASLAGAGAIMVMVLPETGKRPLPETLQECTGSTLQCSEPELDAAMQEELMLDAAKESKQNGVLCGILTDKVECPLSQGENGQLLNGHIDCSV